MNGFKQNDLSTSGKWFVDMLKKAGVGIGSALSGTTEAGQGDASGMNEGSSENGSGAAQTGMDAADVAEILTAGDGLSYVVSNSWNTADGAGVQLALTVKNDTAKELVNWERRLTIQKGAAVKVEQNWNCTVEREENILILRPVDYNKVIAAEGNVGEIGIILNITK